MGSLISNFFSTLKIWLQYILDYIVGIVSGIASAVISILKNILNVIVGLFMDAIDYLLAASGIDNYIQVINTNYTDALGYFLNLFMVPQAVSALGLAYLIRFAIRRLPLVG